MQYVNLTFSDKDVGKRFARIFWAKSLWFTYDSESGNYVYNNGCSVGTSVLYRDDLVVVYEEKKQNKINKGKDMARNVDYIGTGYRVVEVTYDLYSDIDLDTYMFKTDKDVKIGDLVVVESASGFGICRAVSDAIERSLATNVVRAFNKAKAWVVDVVDVKEHNMRKEATERKAFIMEQLKERKEAIEEQAIYTMLAQQDQEAAKLLEELKTLS